MQYTVKQLGEIAGISVRTLHYYDEIGLLKPSFTARNGYRYYGEKELLRLQQILFFKELGFPLEKIQSLMSSPSFDTLAVLKDQRKWLEIQKVRFETLIETLDKTIASVKGGERMKSDDIFGGLSKKQMEEYQKEAEERWGDTEAWKQSQERTTHWTKEDYDRIAKKGAEWTQKMADLMNSGLSPESSEIQEMIRQHYEGLKTFYEPNYEMYKGLGHMYVDDPRFTAYYEKFGKGLAAFMRDAMVLYADKQLSK